MSAMSRSGRGREVQKEGYGGGHGEVKEKPAKKVLRNLEWALSTS